MMVVRFSISTNKTLIFPGSECVMKKFEAPGLSMMKRYIEFLLIWSSGFKVPWNTFRLTLSLSLPRPSFKCLGAKVIVCCIMRWDTPLDRNSYLKNQSFLHLLKTWKKEAHCCITYYSLTHLPSVHWFLGQLKKTGDEALQQLLSCTGWHMMGCVVQYSILVNTFEKKLHCTVKWKLK